MEDVTRPRQSDYFHVFIFLFRIVSFNNKLKVITINWHQYNATETE